MRITRLALAALIVPALLVASPADAASHHKRVARPMVSKSARGALVATTATTSAAYTHTESLTFTPGDRYPVLNPAQHCSGFYVVRFIAYFNGPVLVCG